MDIVADGACKEIIGRDQLTKFWRIDFLLIKKTRAFRTAR